MMEEKKKIKLLALGAIAFVIIASAIGVGYSQFASFVSNENAMENDYVTINITTAGGDNLTDGVMFDYTANYDTFTDYGNNIQYMLQADDQRIALNDEPYKFIIDGPKDDAVYKVSAKMSSIKALYEDSGMTKRCYYIIELSDGVKTYESTPLTNSQLYVFKDGENIANLPNGEYELMIYLEMDTEPDVFQGSGPYVPVDKTKFVDQFTTDGIILTFRAEPPAA